MFTHCALALRNGSEPEHTQWPASDIEVTCAFGATSHNRNGCSTDCCPCNDGDLDRGNCTRVEGTSTPTYWYCRNLPRRLVSMMTLYGWLHGNELSCQQLQRVVRVSRSIFNCTSPDAMIDTCHACCSCVVTWYPPIFLFMH